jgi:hypothetical protein
MQLKITKYLHSKSKFLTFLNIFNTLVAEQNIFSFCFQEEGSKNKSEKNVTSIIFPDIL